VACERLNRALLHVGKRSRLLVQEQNLVNDKIENTSAGGLKKWADFSRFVFERLAFLPHERDKSVRYGFSLANTGEDLSGHPLVRGADVLHLHWFNQGFLSFEGIEKLLGLGKPVVWTLHDMWAFTGGCHYAGDCTRFRGTCGDCPMLRKPGPTDLSTQIWRKKRDLFKVAPITFVTCSQWLQQKALESGLLRDATVLSIPNAIDTRVFRPTARVELRQRMDLDPGTKFILFGAANVNDPRKGFPFLAEALRLLKLARPDEAIELVVFGKVRAETLRGLPFPTRSLGYLRSADQIADTYAFCDVFVLPSLDDNLPNTIMESMSCGTPVVAFRTGGIPEMVEHLETGFLAEPGSAQSLAEGLSQVLFEISPNKMRARARIKVQEEFSFDTIGRRYGDLYQRLSPST